MHCSTDSNKSACQYLQQITSGSMTTGDNKTGAGMVEGSVEEDESMLLRVTSRDLFLQSTQLKSEVEPLVGIRANIAEVASHIAIARGVPLRVIR